MKKKLFTTLALICCTVIICMAVVADLTGTWKGAVQTPNGDYPVSYTFKTDGEKLTGTANGAGGTIPIVDGKISGSNFSFGHDFNGVPLKITGKFMGDSISIAVDYQGTPLPGKLKRVEEKK